MIENNYQDNKVKWHLLEVCLYEYSLCFSSRNKGKLQRNHLLWILTDNAMG